MTESAPTGKRFSQVYLDRDTPQRDTKRFRNRLFALIEELGLCQSNVFLKYFRSETGTDKPYDSYSSHWKSFISAHAEIRDILDLPTLAFQYIIATSGSAKASGFIMQTRRLLLEESMGYRLDDQGGMHPLVDSEFEWTRTATIAGLGLPRYGAALAHFEASHDALDGPVPDTRTAIREMFDAVETVFKLMLPVARLGATEIKKDLTIKVQQRLSGSEKNATARMLASFSEWTNAAHHYRHAEGVEEPSAPSMDHAVLMMGAGATYLRWLTALDRLTS